MERRTYQSKSSPFDSRRICMDILKWEEPQINDNLIWTKTPNGKLNPKLVYNLIQDPKGDSLNSGVGISQKPWKSIWNVRNMPPRVVMFTWWCLHPCVISCTKQSQDKSIMPNMLYRDRDHWTLILQMYPCSSCVVCFSIGIMYPETSQVS